jgi:YVTN family beta-propeller protein
MLARKHAYILAGLGLCVAFGFVAPQIARRTPGKQPDNSVLVPTNQTLTPVGTVQLLGGTRPKDIALSPDGRSLAVLTTQKLAFFTSEGQPAGEVAFSAAPLGIVWTPDGQTLYASQNAGKVARFQKENGIWRNTGEFEVERGNPVAGQPKNPQANGLAVSPDGKRLYVALGIRNAVAILALPEMRLEQTVPVGVAPYAVALSANGKTLFIANRGGSKVARDPNETAPSAGTPVRIDRKTDAALRGSLSILDTTTLQTKEIAVGRQPSQMAFSPEGGLLYIANSDDDTVSVVDIRSHRVRRVLSVRPPQDPGFGQIPTDVALSSDGKRIYVTCGGANAVAVFERERLLGYVPTGWFPIALEERDGRLYVASAKGIGARHTARAKGFGVHDSVGMVQIITPDDRRDLASLTQQVAFNNRWGMEEVPEPGQKPVPVPLRVGEPSVFKHVVFLIKENMTYDSVLGDMPEGNGDPSLCLFGDGASPNHHALAREFVLLDNTYTSGTNSADGHQWTVSSVANGYMEQNYGAHSRSYPYDGGDPLAYSPAGFLWNAARRKGLSVRVYGEFVSNPSVVDPATGKTPSWTELWQDYKAGTNKYRITADTDQASLKPLLHPNYIGFPSIVSDQWRADQFLKEFAEFERVGKMPALCILLLPNDHTAGTRPGMPRPRSAVADNDLAMGRIIEKITKSRFWKETLILVVQDDTQLGLDHVDGHRMPAFCISPYTKRGAVVSQMYNHTSFVRTIGLILGFPALNRFDRTATPLTECFTETPDFRPYTALPNQIALNDMNPPARALRGEARRLALASEKLDWSDVDRADATTVARAIWLSAKPNTPFPWRHFHPNRDDD